MLCHSSTMTILYRLPNQSNESAVCPIVWTSVKRTAFVYILTYLAIRFPPGRTCEYCSAREVCRFKGEEAPERYVRPASDKAALLEQLVKTGTENPTKIGNAKMKDESPAEARKDETEDDIDDDED